MGFSASNFISGMLAIMIGATVFGACLTIFGNISVGEGIANAGSIEALIGLLPILLAIGLVLGAVYIFVSRK